MNSEKFELQIIKFVRIRHFNKDTNVFASFLNRNSVLRK